MHLYDSFGVIFILNIQSKMVDVLMCSGFKDSVEEFSSWIQERQEDTEDDCISAYTSEDQR